MPEVKKDKLLDDLVYRLQEKVMGLGKAKMELAGIHKVHADTGISIRTLKRLFGMEKAPPGYYPYFGTREILCAYAGFSDWAEFVRANTKAEMQFFTAQSYVSKSVTPASELFSADVGKAAEPFRDLDWLHLGDSRMFMSRKRSCLEVQAYLTAPFGDQVILIYGLSGVSQSLFLHSGLMPRLAGRCATHYYRREKENRLPTLLSSILSSVQHTNCPTVAILDQVEAVYAGSVEAGDEELLEFATQLAASVRRFPNLKVLLSFRKEYFAEIDDCLTSQGIGYKRYFL